MWMPGSKFSFSNHKIVELWIQRGRKTAKSSITALELRRAVLGLVQRSAWKTPVAHSAGKRSRWAWWFFKYHLLQDKQQSKQRLTTEFLTELTPEKETHRRQQQGQVPGRNTEVLCVCRYGDRKAKAHPKLHLVKHMEGKKKDCCGCIWVGMGSCSWRTRLRPHSPWVLMVKSAFQSKIQVKDVKTRFCCIYSRYVCFWENAGISAMSLVPAVYWKEKVDKPAMHK